MDDSAYHDLPDDPELAFLCLEDLFYQDLASDLARYDLSGLLPVLKTPS